MAVTYKELKQYFWPFLRRQKLSFGSIFVIDCLAWPLDALIWPFILRFAIDTFTLYEGDRAAAWKPLLPVIICSLALVVCVEVASRLMGFLMATACPKLQARIRMNMFDHVGRHSPQYFNERFAGNLANKITDMTSQVDLILRQLFWPIIPAVSTCILGSVFLWFVNPIFSGLLLFWTFSHIAICVIFARPADVYEVHHAEVRSALLGKIVDSLTNNFTVNLFYRFKHERRFIQADQVAEEETNKIAKIYVEKMRCLLSIFYFVFVIIGMFGLLLYLWFHNLISTGEVTQVITTMWSLSMTLWSVGTSFPILFHSFGSLKQAYSVIKDPQDLGDKANARVLKVLNGEIVFDNVSFSYNEKKLFVNKHVHIRGGEKIGLIGYTGAGKSSFINLILRFFPIQEGEISIDGQEIKNVTLKSLRRQIALIPQDPILFHRSLGENILYGRPDASKEEMIAAAKLAHCDEFIRQIPNGYDAKVGERGTKLSGGEKQRIAIARAILANAPILILDEATSSLDSLTESYIQDSLDKLMENRTTIVVAHRLSTLSRMDRILVFDKGVIVEEGDHDSLLGKGGLYSHMWKMQVGGFLPEQD